MKPGMMFASLASAALLSAAEIGRAGAAESTRQQVFRQGKITIGISNSAPWGYRNSDGRAAGFHPDLIREAFSKLGVATVELVITEFGALIPGLLAKRFDAVAAGLYITPDRCKLVAFSEPDMRLADAALVLKGNPKKIHGYLDIANSADIRLGAGRGSVTAKNAATAGVPESRTLLFADIQTNVSALLAGRIDVAVFSAPTVVTVLSGRNIEGIERAAPFVGFRDNQGLEVAGYSAIAFRPDDADLRDLYNERLAIIKREGVVSRTMAAYGFSKAEFIDEGVTTASLCSGGR